MATYAKYFTGHSPQHRPGILLSHGKRNLRRYITHKKKVGDKKENGKRSEEEKLMDRSITGMCLITTIPSLVETTGKIIPKSSTVERLRTTRTVWLFCV